MTRYGTHNIAMSNVLGYRNKRRLHEARLVLLRPTCRFLKDNTLNIRVMGFAALLTYALFAYPNSAVGQQDDIHWAFRPITLSVPPQLDSDWPRNPIDSFILEKLNDSQLRPAKPASANQLSQRLHLDMLGILPADTVASNLPEDLSDVAWSKLIDEVLASPYYGERWGRHWLDLARYADSNGFEFDFVRPYAWRYRDYVISAFNRDKRYDQFIREQLAGDELDRTSLESWVATGFCRNGPTVGNQTLAKNKYEELHDVITATTEVFLGLTVGCARCHDHKFDPISQKDYYSMLAIFHTIGKRDQFIGTAEERRTYDSLKRQKKELEETLKSATTDLQAGDWHLKEGTLTQSSMVNNTRVWFGDKSWTNYIFEVELLRTRATQQPFSFDAGVYISVLAEDYSNGYTLQLGASDDREHALHFEKNSSRHSLAPRVRGRLANNQWYRLRIEVGQGVDRIWLDDQLLFEFDDKRHAAGGISLGNWATSTQWKNLRVTNQQGDLLLNSFPLLERMSRPENSDGFDVEAVKKQLEAIDHLLAKLPLAQSITDNSYQAEPTNVHIRGEYDNPGEVVQPAIPESISNIAVDFPVATKDAHTTGRRSILANWIAHKDNPLTARVMVNRIWQFHFGRGIVESPSNFGLLGFEPSHPRLLDWLAAEFIRSEWSVKHIHKLILESSTYRQSSKITNTHKEDPDARLLSRFPMRRHDAEVIRDRILQASGSINLQMGGPGVYPHVNEEIIGSGTTRKWPRVVNDSPEQWRRSVYIFVRRSVPFPLLEGFDAPVTTSSCSRRITTTVPTQALQLLNSRFTNQQSLNMARLLIHECGEDRRNLVRQAYRRVLGRSPDDNELMLSIEFLQESENLHGPNPSEKLLQSIQDLCHVLINLSEFVFMP